MPTRSTDPDSCPVCRTVAPTRRVLIEYGTAAGPVAFATCPNCGSVVHPG